MSPHLSSGLRAIWTKKDNQQNRAYSTNVNRVKREIVKHNKAVTSVANQSAAATRGRGPQLITRSEKNRIIRNLKTLEQGGEIAVSAKNIQTMKELGEMGELGYKPKSNARLAIRMADRANRQAKTLQEKSALQNAGEMSPREKREKEKEVAQKENALRARARAERREANEKAMGVTRVIGQDPGLTSATSIADAQKKEVEAKRREQEEEQRRAASNTFRGGLD